MKLFIDTANVEEIRKANDMGVICGGNPCIYVPDYVGERVYTKVVRIILSYVCRGNKMVWKKG